MLTPLARRRCLAVMCDIAKERYPDRTWVPVDPDGAHGPGARVGVDTASNRVEPGGARRSTGEES